MSPTLIAALSANLQALSCQITQLIAVQRATLPTFLGMKELQAKWPALTAPQITALAVEHAGFQPGPGKRLALHLDQVLHIDAILAGRIVVGRGHVGRTPSCPQGSTGEAA